MTPPRPPRVRLDALLVERGLAENRSRAQALILAGRVSSGERILDKPGVRHPVDLEIVVREGRRWVGRGARKMLGALERFDVPVEGRLALDVGASTGGFTQVLLEAGAERVIALDVGRGQLDWSLRRDPRVHPLEGTNARRLRPEDLPFRPSLAVIDVSFISLRLVLPPTVAVLDPESVRRDVVVLIKPQFEVGRGRVGRGGVVRDPAEHRRVLDEFLDWTADASLAVRALCASPIAGADGNREFLAHVAPGTAPLPRIALDRRVQAALGSGADQEERP